MLDALAAESTLQPPHQSPRRALRHLGFEAALVDALDPGLKVRARVDQPLRRGRELIDDSGVAVLGIAEPAFRTASLDKRDLARLDGPLRQKPGHDMHDARRHLERLAGESDASEWLKRLALVAASIVKIRTR